MILKVSKNYQSASASDDAQYLADWECLTIISSVCISPKNVAVLCSASISFTSI